MTEHTLQGIAARIDALAAQTPELLKAHPDEGDFISAFAGDADCILADAGAVSDDVHEYAFQRLEEILIQAGVVDAAHRTT